MEKAEVVQQRVGVTAKETMKASENTHYSFSYKQTEYYFKKKKT
jgi:hypothetical protein